MKPTQITELFANIRKTFVSFFSILMFVALGVGIFLGISWAAPALQAAADRVYDEGSFHDFQIQYVYGLTDADLERLTDDGIAGVTDAEGARQSFQTLTVGGVGKSVKVQSLGERIDVPLLVEGELPARSDEIALIADAARELGLGVGDAVEFAPDADDGMAYLTGSAFKVTSLVDSPEYLAKSSATYGYAPTASGAVDLVAWVPAAAFEADAFQNAYPVVNVRCDGLRGVGTFSDAYKRAAAGLESSLSGLVDELAAARYDGMKGTAQGQVDEEQVQLDDAKAKIEAGERQIEEGRATLESERAKGEAELASARGQLASAQARYDDGLAQYNAAKTEYDQAVGQAQTAQAQIAELQAERRRLEKDFKAGKATDVEYAKRMESLAAKANGQLAAYKRYLGEVPDITVDNFDGALALAALAAENYRSLPFVYDGKEMTLDEASRQLDEAASELAAAEAEINAGWARVQAAQDALNQKVAEGEQQLAEAQRQVDEGRQQVAEGEQQLAAAEEQLAQFVQHDAAVVPRSRNSSVAEVSTFAGVTGNLSFSMAALFVIVGLLVSYSAVSRIVHEQIMQIGTKKALGLREREITLGFLAYSGLAVAAGAVIGTIVGVSAVEGIIGHVLGGMFILGDYPPYFGPGLFLAVTLLELVLVLGATWLACHSILHEQAVELLKGERPPDAKTRFYEKWGNWERLPLFTQTIVNNCMNDKRRVFSTVVGVAGCTALIVTAITLNDDVLKSYDRHYEDVYGFNAVAYVDESAEGEVNGVEAVLEREGEGGASARVARKAFALTSPNGDTAAVRVVVPADAEAFARVYHVNPVAGAAFDPDAQGAWMSQAYADHFGAKVGDTVSVNAGDGVEHEVPILGFHEFWLTYHEMVMGPSYYEAEFGNVSPNAVLIDTGDLSVKDMGAVLAGVDGFVSIEDDKAAQGGAFREFASVSRAVVLIYLVLSVLMAVVVLLNLNVMFIDEKKRELIVLMINGFSVRDAKRYIYNDTIALTAVGIVCGVVLGCVMGAVTVGSVEPSTATFVKDVDVVAVAVGALGSAALAAIMAIVALRRIPRFELTDINKF